MNSNGIWYALIKVNLIWITLIVFMLIVGIFLSKSTFTDWAKKHYSEVAMKRMNIAVKIFSILIVILLITVLAIPITRDSVSLIRRGVSWDNVGYRTGTIRVCHRFAIIWCLSQGFEFVKESDNYSLFISSTLVREGKNYEIYYLPRSRVVLKIKRLPDTE